MQYKILGSKKRASIIFSILLIAASFSSISSARANGASPTTPDEASITSCAFDGQQNRTITFNSSIPELVVNFTKEGGDSVFLKEYQNNQFIFSDGPNIVLPTTALSWDNLFGAYGAATVRDDFYSFWISDGAAVPIGDQPLCSISVIIQAPTTKQPARQTTNLSFDQSQHGSDTLSDPDGQLRKTLDSINAKYGNLLR